MNSECLNNWKQEGHVSLWRYTNSSRHRYTGLNLSGDSAAIQSLVDLTRCLADEPGTRTVRLAQPTQAALSIPGFDSDYEWFRKIKLGYEGEHHGIVFAIVGDSLVLTIGHSGILTLRGALGRYGRGDCDFAMPCEVSGGGKYDRAVWFW
jgi:hypothetical protein